MNDDSDEIKRIQLEIDRDLDLDLGHDPDRDPECGPDPGGETDTETRNYEPAPAVIAPASESFYTEVIKKEVIRDEPRRGKRRPRRSLLAAVLLTITGGIFIGGGIGIGIPLANRVIIPRILGEPAATAETQRDPFAFNETPKPEFTEPKSYTLYNDNLSAIVSLVEPSVVGVTTVTQSTGANYFFSPQRDYPNQASGIIFHQDGDNIYIVTNYHVVNGASVVSVSVSGSEPVSARSIGSESASDIAVMAVLKKDLRDVGVDSVIIATFGDSDNVLVGETVLAIGNALGEGNTATRGIISAKNKEIIVQNGMPLTVLQTDAAINPGNSGGPLVNTKGEVIGINTAKINESAIEGTGYSITSNVAKSLVEEIMNQKEKAFLGVLMSNLTEELAEMFNIPEIGVLIEEVYEGTSADKAGIKRYDVITGFDGKPVMTKEDLRNYVSECEIGDEVEIKLLRDGTNVLTIIVNMLPNPASTGF